MSGSKVAVRSACQLGFWLVGIAILAAAAVLAIPAQAQDSAPSLDGRVVVMGEGSIGVTPDYAQVAVGVTTRGKTVKEANDANTKLMAAVTSTLLGFGIAQKDIQTSEFSVQPVYAQQDSHGQQKLDGYNVLNQVSVRIHQIEKVGDILDGLVPAGVTDVGNITFLVSDPSKALDAARASAIADARHKAEIYAQASGLQLGRVISITEDPESIQPILTRSVGGLSAMAASTPIAAGENTLRVRIAVAFDIAH
jgi:uncharacterized protein